jgi:hypothetical protein
VCGFDSAQLEATTFWSTFADLHRQPLLRSYEQPWLFGALKAAGLLPPDAREREPLAGFAERLRAYVMAFVHRGQALGVIRTDLNDELLFAWLESLDCASDDWLLARWTTLEREQISHISDETVAAMRRVLSP